jgi:YebC/PmpR family DNA-binding regulatory protein
MSGHSKWASIKHKKGAADAKRGKLFTKLIREITVAAKDGGGDPDINPALRTAISRANDANMPKDNIEKAIKKGTGELPGVSYESCLFEGYGPGGVAILVEALTDNKNRSSAEIRNIFSKKSGNMAGAGSVSWIFTPKGYILINQSQIDEEELFAITVDAGAEDIKSSDKNYEIFCEPKSLEAIKEALAEKKIKWEIAELNKIPNSTVKLSGNQAKQVLALVETLEDHDDVQKVYANFDIPDEVLEEIAQEI